jgi:hypothetical protein
LPVPTGTPDPRPPPAFLEAGQLDASVFPTEPVEERLADGKPHRLHFDLAPLLSNEPEVREVEKLSAAELWQDYRTWVERNPDLLARIEADELESERRERYDPAWEPRALLNGAGAFGSRVQDRMLSLWEKQRKAQ